MCKYDNLFFVSSLLNIYVPNNEMTSQPLFRLWSMGHVWSRVSPVWSILIPVSLGSSDFLDLFSVAVKGPKNKKGFIPIVFLCRLLLFLLNLH